MIYIYIYIHTIIIKRWLDFPYCTNVYWISFEGLLSVFHLKECHPCQEKAAPKAAKATAEAKPKAAAADKKSATTAATPRAEAKVKAPRHHKPFKRNGEKNSVFVSRTGFFMNLKVHIDKDDLPTFNFFKIQHLQP